MLPESLKTALENLFDSNIVAVRGVGGGSINQAVKVEVESGLVYFVKWNHNVPDDRITKEQKGMKLLRDGVKEMYVHRVIKEAKTADGISFLVMEYVVEGAPQSDSHRQFGRALATLHQITAKQYGLDHDNYLGRLPQSNKQYSSWVDFFVEQRLAPQLRQAVDSGLFSTRVTDHFQRLYKKLPELLPSEPPSLLHGDLWSGNYFYDQKGRAVLYDPAVYYGHREMELAFTHLFGGFTSAFYQAYEETFPLQAGFEERKNIYNLYPLLVHTNLFGASYARQVQAIVQRF